MSFAVRYKLGGWWKNTIIWRFLHFNYRILRRILLGIKYPAASALTLADNSWAGGPCRLQSFHNSHHRTQYRILLIIWLLGKLIFIPAILYITINLHQLKIGSQRIAGGDLEYRIDTRRLFWEFKRHGENLNNISAGMSKAVEERLKSERFKTELITNVSHDIKTPLTSIINYVDLLKRKRWKRDR